MTSNRASMMSRCTAICRNGKLCPNNARNGGDLCGVHVRSNRHAASKAIQRGADSAKGVANVVIAAVAVAKAAHMIAEYWPTIVKALSHVVNFCYETDDSHRALTYKQANSLEKIAAEFEKVK